MSESPPRARRVGELVGSGEHDLALQIARQWTDDDPSSAEAHNALGTVHAARRDLDSAARSFQRATEIDPTLSKAFSNLGSALRSLGDLSRAVEVLNRAVELDRSNARAWSNLGNAYKQAGHLDEAIAAYRRSIELRPGAASASVRIALAEVTLHLAGPDRAAEALAGLEPAPATAAGYWAAQAAIAEARGDLDAAERAAQTSAEASRTAHAWCEVARIRERRRDLRGATDAIAAAATAEPHSPAPAMHRGELAMARNDLATAQAAFEEASQKAPGSSEPLANLAQIALRRGDVERAIAMQRDVLARSPSQSKAHSNLLLTLQYRDRPPEQRLVEALRWSRDHAGRPVGARFPLPSPTVARLRVGYVSADLREHAVARFLEDLVAAHDRERFELYFYDAAPHHDEVTVRLAAHGDTWRQVHAWGDHRLASVIRDDAIDVLVDLNGHTAGSRLRAFVARPAPVLVSFLGYPDTTGVAAIDARITDANADPCGLADRYATEALVRLPRCAWSFHPAADAPEVEQRPRGAPPVFAVFNNVAKITDEARRTFARILREVPGSRLLFKGRTLGDEETRARFLATFVEAGVSERVELRSWTRDAREHHASYAEVDIQLDAFPYAGTTTTCESLWMGVPVVTLAGTHHAARVGVSLLHAVGLADLVARDLDDYVARAAALAHDPARRARLRSTLRARMHTSPLCDGRGYARAVEDIYSRLHATWREYAVASGGMPDAWLTQADGSVLSVPDDPAWATRLVLELHGEEDQPELTFVRRFLDLGETAADIGAGFGVYTLAMAKRVGATGRVLAFEPEALPALHLKRSAARAPAVRVLDEMPTLDRNLDALEGVRFIRIDADGQEERVLGGARRLLAREDPVWMWTLPTDGRARHGLIDALAAAAPQLVTMGWSPDRELLVPVELRGSVEAGRAYFFAISAARRTELAARRLAT